MKMTGSLGRIARRALRAIPQDKALPILTGPLRGKKWIIGSGLLGTWIGHFERAKQQELVSLLRRGDVVYDVGAHAGLYTLLSAQLVGDAGVVCAFEPLPRNIEFLRRHIALNGCTNVDVINSAVSDGNEPMMFDVGTNSYEGRLSTAGTLKVPCVTLDEVAANHRLPTVIKIDVEGAELAVLRGGARLLASHNPVLLLATHSEALRADCSKYLRNLGYAVNEIAGQHDELIACKR